MARALWTHDPSFILSRPFLGCFCRTLSPARCQIRSPLFMVHMPATVVQHSGDHATSVMPELSCHLNDVLGLPFFVRKTEQHLALRGATLHECAEGPHSANARIRLPQKGRSDTPRVCCIIPYCRTASAIDLP